MEGHVFRKVNPEGVFSEHVCTLYLRLFGKLTIRVLIIFIQISLCSEFA